MILKLNKLLAATRRLAGGKISRDRELQLKELMISSGLFDAEFYLKQNPDIAASVFDPAIHYIRYGGAEQRDPSPKFDAHYYLSMNSDVRDAHLNPLLHYLEFGRFENRQIRDAQIPAPRANMPEMSEWDSLAAHFVQLSKGKSIIDVVVPVYRGLDETANCLLTVLRSRLVCKHSFEVVVIDDASPEPKLSKLLDELAERKLITLIRNNKNCGFVSSSNKGMELHDNRDVIILNSDTEVYGDWVDRMYRTAYSELNIGTVTPMSNKATICSYPYFNGEFDGAFEVAFDEIDRLTSSANAGLIVDIPTAIGFCMYIRRECLREVGLFDTIAFSRGYGEENDFSKRIAARGWRNVMVGDVFVRHLGRVSFGDTSAALVKKALAIINFRYPNYNKEVAAYIQNDPPKEMRKNLDIARLHQASGKKNFLFVLHNLGGGTLKHVNELVKLLTKAGIGSLVLQPDPANDAVALLSHPSVRNLSVIDRLDIKHDLSSAVELVRRLGIEHIHVHHLFGFASEISRFIQIVAQENKIKFDFTLHDYLPVCPRINMIDNSRLYCNNTKLQVCESCIVKNGSLYGSVSVWHWRSKYEQFLQSARKVFAPSEAAKRHINQFMPTLPIEVRPHPESIPSSLADPIPQRTGEPLHVAIIGAIGSHKGSSVLVSCAQDAALRKLPIKFTVFGYTDDPSLAQVPNVNIIGPYFDKNLPALLARAQCHIAFFPSVWPETYCYTLSNALFAGLYPVAFDIGALAERIRACGWGHIIPFELASHSAKINDILLTLRPISPSANWHPVPGEMTYKEFITDYYGFDLGEKRHIQDSLTSSPSRHSECDTSTRYIPIAKMLP